jgi:hypothetical protein
MNAALKHANACFDLLEDGKLDEALNYCTAHKIVPPQYPDSAEAAVAESALARVKAMLSDYGWWEKRLKIRAARAARTLSRTHAPSGRQLRSA